MYAVESIGDQHNKTTEEGLSDEVIQKVSQKKNIYHAEII